MSAVPFKFCLPETSIAKASDNQPLYIAIQAGVNHKNLLLQWILEGSGNETSNRPLLVQYGYASDVSNIIAGGAGITDMPPVKLNPSDTETIQTVAKFTTTAPTTGPTQWIDRQLDEKGRLSIDGPIAIKGRPDANNKAGLVIKITNRATTAKNISGEGRHEE